MVAVMTYESLTWTLNMYLGKNFRSAKSRMERLMLGITTVNKMKYK